MFDAHFHILDPRFPLIPNRGYLPPPFPVEAYREAVAPLGIEGGAVVSGSFHAFDQRGLEHALRTLGPGFVGVAQLGADTPDAEILRLDRLGVRAVRFNLVRGVAAPGAALRQLGERVCALAGWHVELYVDARDLPELESDLRSLPHVGIDHLGLSREGLPHLLRLVERGGFVKASGFGRLDFDPADALRKIAAVDPRAIVFGTDLPGTRAARPFEREDLERLRDALGQVNAERALSINFRDIYLRR